MILRQGVGLRTRLPGIIVMLRRLSFRDRTGWF